MDQQGKSNRIVAQFPTPFGGSLGIWAITVEERAKYDQQFHHYKLKSEFITGIKLKTFFSLGYLNLFQHRHLLVDMNNDGGMDQVEFSKDMKHIKKKL